MRTIVPESLRDLLGRRLGSPERTDRFLRADLADVPSPRVLTGLEETADRIEHAIRTNERILIFGHDDPDGITSCGLLAEALVHRGARPLTYIPDRRVEGHGLYPELIDRIVRRGVGLLVTTDGCSANVDEVERARRSGTDVRVTDHHVLAPGREAVPHVLNPLTDPATAETYGDLTGAGVAAWLARELLQRGGHPDAWEGLLDLVALGTVADHGDCTRNNRAMVVHGLRACARGDRPAVERALRRLGIEDPFRVEDTRRLAAMFAVIPSVHGDSRGLRALLGEDGWRNDVDKLAAEFLNAEATVAAAVTRGRERAREHGILDGAPAVLRMDELDVRHLGAVAGDLMRETGRPAAVLARHDDTLVGELRGPEHVHLVEILGAMRDRFDSWGGHRRAAGFSAPAPAPAPAPADADGADGADGLEAALRAALDVAAAPADSEEAPELAGPPDVAFREALRQARPWCKSNPEPRFRVNGRLVGAEELLREGEAS